MPHFGVGHSRVTHPFATKSPVSSHRSDRRKVLRSTCMSKARRQRSSCARIKRSKTMPDCGSGGPGLWRIDRYRSCLCYRVFKDLAPWGANSKYARWSGGMSSPCMGSGHLRREAPLVSVRGWGLVVEGLVGSVVVVVVEVRLQGRPLLFDGEGGGLEGVVLVAEGPV